MTILEEITAILYHVKKDSSEKDKHEKALKAARDRRYQTSPKGKYAIYKQRLRRKIRHKRERIAQLERSIYE